MAGTYSSGGGRMARLGLCLHRSEVVKTRKKINHMVNLLYVVFCGAFAQGFLQTPWKNRGALMMRKAKQPQDLSLGAPSSKPINGFYTSPSEVKVTYEVESLDDPSKEINRIIDSIDNSHGVLLTSSYEYPGRYTRWTVGFTAPALKISGKGLHFQIDSLNDRGKILIDIILARIGSYGDLFSVQKDSKGVGFSGDIKFTDKYFPEEDRSKQPSLFSIIRILREIFQGLDAGQLGLYGALGYDLTFQFETVKLKKERDSAQQDLILYLPDEIFVMDNQKKDAWKIKYEFEDLRSGRSTKGLDRGVVTQPYQPPSAGVSFQKRDNEPGDYAKAVVRAKEEFRVGNLFEVVLTQIFREKLNASPSEVFRRITRRNPSPYGFFMNLGDNEYLIGASPEMFVRVEQTPLGTRVETCPISGTIERGSDPIEDALQIKKLLANSKEESELTMCTDVDRNDKSRICKAGSVRVLGRRQIEIYSRLIHTVDHVEGYLRDGYDALDAFLCHTWAVTVTGAPKTWAIRFIEDMEPSPRLWYGGAVGMIGFDGSLNTGLTLRTIRVKGGVGEVRAGATLLHDSHPPAEEAETELKASALIDAIVRPDEEEQIRGVVFPSDGSVGVSKGSGEGEKKRVLLVDHEDSFVHTLANYLRQTGADVVTCRSGAPLQEFLRTEVDSQKFKPDLVVLSPGPGSPSDFQLSQTIQQMIDRKVPIFGVCLGLQGLVEFFGGKLDVLGYPMHGKPSNLMRMFNDDGECKVCTVLSRGKIDSDILQGLPEKFSVARYHSLHGNQKTFPQQLTATAMSEDGIIMAIQHRHLPIAAVQFHPESILTLPKHGMQILVNALSRLDSAAYDNKF